MQKNNDFLNTLTTSAHIFLQRNISHYYNVDRKERASRDVNGRITVANYEKLALFAMSFYIHLIWSVSIGFKRGHSCYLRIHTLLSLIHI